MESVHETIIKLNSNFQKLHFENNLKFFSDILPDKISEIKTFIIRVHEKFPLPYGVDDLIWKTNTEQECINELIIGKDLNYLQKITFLVHVKVKLKIVYFNFVTIAITQGFLHQ